MNIKDYFLSFIQKNSWLVFYQLEIFFLHLKVRGRDNIKNLSKNSVLFIANHSSSIDSFFIGTSIPRSYYSIIKRFRFIASPKQITRRPYGPFIWLLGAYPVYRHGGDFERSLKKTIEILKDNQSVLIFPTGRLEKHFNPKDARPGVAYLAKKLNLLIVPVLVKNAYKITIFDFLLRMRTVEIIFGKPFYYQEVAKEGMDLRQLAGAIMERVGALAMYSQEAKDKTVSKFKRSTDQLFTKEKHV